MGVIGHNTMTGATCFFHMSHNVANTYRATVTDIMRPAVCAGSRGAVCAGSRGHFGGMVDRLERLFGGMVDRLERPATPRGSLPPGSIRLYAGIEEG